MSRLPSSWSRRRAAVAAEIAAEETAVHDATQKAEHDALTEKSDEDILNELGLPDPDSLEQGDDFKAFMAKAVPQHLRQRALRKLWRSNPVLACVDGLNDYDDDYLTASLGQGAIKTTYQVGKGMLAHLLEVERLRQDPPKVTVKDDPAQESAPEIEVEADVYVTEPVVVEQDPIVPAPRRMQFQFEEDTV